MKAVMISIQPKWVEKIASGEKTVEVRKTRPNIVTPFKCYIYETQGRTETPWIDEDGHEIFKGRGQVIGEFVCDKIIFAECGSYVKLSRKDTQLDADDLIDYADGKPVFGWHISDLVIYDKPKDLDWFRKPMECHRGKQRENCVGCWDCEIKRPPQSWCYVEVQE